MRRRYSHGYRKRGYSRRYRKHYGKRKSTFRTLAKVGRTADKVGWGVVNRAWRVADRAALSGMKLGFGALKGISYLIRR